MVSYLLATDGSDASKRAEQHLLDSLRPGDSVQVLSVAAEPDLVSGYLHARDELEKSSVSTFRDHFLERARNRAETSANRFLEAGFKVDVLIRLGDAGPQICSVADENHLDCVVLGRKGHGSVRERLLGSVSHYVIHHAVCPVTLVPPRDDGSL